MQQIGKICKYLPLVLVSGEFWVCIRFDLETFVAGKVEVPQVLIEVPNRMIGMIR